MSSQPAPRLKVRVDEHEEVLDKHHRRITRNENYRLQIQGALKFAAFILGTSLTIVGLLVGLGIITF